LGAKADGRWMLGSMCMIVLRKNVGLWAKVLVVKLQGGLYTAY
jgi:hypothetical protein